MDRPRRSDCTAGQMDGEAGWWTTSENIGLPPLARVMGVGRQQQQDVKSHERNVVLDGRPPPISNSEKDLIRKERSTLAQLRSGYCRLLGSNKSRIKKDASLNVCADCGTTPHDIKHLFVCPAHPSTMIPSDLWSRPTDAIRELSYLEARDPD